MYIYLQLSYIKDHCCTIGCSTSWPNLGTYIFFSLYCKGKKWSKFDNFKGNRDMTHVYQLLKKACDLTDIHKYFLVCPLV